MLLNLKDFKSNELIKIIRENLNKTQEQFAKELNISRSALQMYEYGTVNYPFEIMEKIIKKYKLEMIIKDK